jgi:ribonuclease E
MPSGASLVIQQTEALVAIDVNSGRSTGESGIEETALKTNIEAAKEIARQIKLRNLSGLIVVDFIDMSSQQNRTVVENALRNAMSSDRVRVQILPISHFGLLEISRQRTNPSLLELSGTTCEKCHGSGFIRAHEYSSMAIIRSVASAFNQSPPKSKYVSVSASHDVVLYILNYKRVIIKSLEEQYGVVILFYGTNCKPHEVQVNEVYKIDNATNFESIIDSEDDISGSLAYNAEAPEVQVLPREPKPERDRERNKRKRNNRDSKNGNRGKKQEKTPKKSGIVAKVFGFLGKK